MTLQHLTVAFCSLIFSMTLTMTSLSSAAAAGAQRSDADDIRLFYDALTPDGEWLRLDPHGWVWIPPALTPGWRPYTIGRWVYTEVGMTWVSAWPWGWATFHYGRWAFNTQYGWFWVPGSVWAPAWVAWQVGNGWVGWAPLPPQAHWDPTVGLSAERIDLIDIEAMRYVFVPAPQVLATELRRHLAIAARSVTLLQQTRNTTAYTTVDERVHNRSLSPTQVTQFVGHAMPQHRLSDVNAATTSLHTRIEGQRVMIFRPDLSRPGPGSDRLLLEPTPLPTTTPSPVQAELAPRQNVARRDLDARLADEYARLLERHEQERKQSTQQEDAQEALRWQHERERQAFDIYAARERQILDNRLRRNRGRVQFRLHYYGPAGQSPGDDQ